MVIVYQLLILIDSNNRRNYSRSFYMKKTLLQALQITFKDPGSGEEHTGFLVGESFLPADKIQKWQESGHNLGSLVTGMKIIPPADFPDLASFPEFESLLDAVATGIDEAAK